MEFITAIYNKLLRAFDVFNIEIIGYYFAIIPLILLLEFLIVGWKKSSIKKIVGFEKTVRTDVVFFLLDVFNFYNLITILLSFGLFHLLARLIYNATNFDLIYTIDHVTLQFVVLFLISDFKNYFSHFLFHRFNTLWTLHEFHHSATEFCMLTRFRGHFLETAIKRMVDVIPFAIFGSVEMYLVVKVLSEIHQCFLHSALKSNWGWIGKYILVSPAAHRLHHSNKRKHYGKNFGSTFIFWDRLFGSYSPDHEAVEELGVPGNEYNKNGVLKDIYLGLVNFFVSLKADFKKLGS